MEISLPDGLISLQKNVSLTIYVDFRLRGLLLAVTFHLLHVGVIRLLLYLHLVSYRFYIDITDTKWSNTGYRIDSVSAGIAHH